MFPGDPPLFRLGKNTETFLRPAGIAAGHLGWGLLAMETGIDGRAAAPESSAQIRNTLGLLPVIALSAALTSPAYAQTATPAPGNAGAADSDVVLQQVNVQGKGDNQAKEGYKVNKSSNEKLTAPLLDTPRTVTVITQKQMEERGQNSIADVLRTTPGVTLGTGEGGNPMGDRPFIRGYEASTDMSIDGVRSLGRTTYESFNLESVEIIKGPAGALAGRGNTGGSLNMVSKKARLGESFHEFSGMIGTDSQYRGTYDGNFGTDNIAGRINLMWQDAEVPGRGGIEDDKWGVAGSLTGQISEATKLIVGLYHSKSDSTPDFGIPMANDAYEAYRIANGAPKYGSGTKDDPYLPIGNVNHKQFFGLFNRDFREVTNQAGTLRLEHEFSDTLRLDSTLAWIGNEQKYVVTRPTFEATGGGVLQRAARSGMKKNRTLAWVTNLSGEAQTGSLEHSYVLGFEMSKEQLRSGSISGFPSGTSAFNTPDYLNPNPWLPVDMSGLTYGPYGDPTTTKSRSLYAFDTIRFNERWEANIGLRYEHFDVEQGALNRKDDIFSYQLGLVYKPLPNGSVYVSYGTSANPSGQCASLAGGSEGSGACTLTGNNEDLAPEKNRSYEIGTKWDLFDDRISVTAALFRTEKTNARTTDQFGNVDLVGSSRAQGIELGVAGNVTERWAVAGGYTYTDAKLTDAGYVGGVPSPNTGNYLHYIARHSFSVWSTYDVTEKWKVGGGATYTGKRYMNAANTSALPEQWRVDLMTSYAFNEHTSLQLNVNNVFDEKLYDASHVGLFANTGPGRNATLKLNVKF